MKRVATAMLAVVISVTLIVPAFANHDSHKSGTKHANQKEHHQKVEHSNKTQQHQNDEKHKQTEHQHDNHLQGVKIHPEYERKAMAGQVIGKFTKTAHHYSVFGKQTVAAKRLVNKLPKYQVTLNSDGKVYDCICIEDLAHCGYKHIWDEKSRTTKFEYDGQNFKGLSDLKSNSGVVYGSDIDVLVKDDKNDTYVVVTAYNVGGYSLVPVENLHELMFIADEGTEYYTNPDHKIVSQKVNVTLPNFKVTLNGKVFDNQNNKYP